MASKFKALCLLVHIVKDISVVRSLVTKNIFSYKFFLLCVPIKDYPDKIQWTEPEEEQLTPVPEQACTNLHSGNIWK